MADVRGSPLLLRALVLVLLALTPLGEAAVGVASTSELAMRDVVIPVTFAAGLTGTTTLGTNRTSAQTDVPSAGTLVSATSLVLVESRTLQGQTTNMRLASVSGLSRVSTATVTLGGTTQISISNGELLRLEGPGVPLAGGTSLTAGGDLQVTKGNNAHLTIDVVSRDSRGIELVEQWVLVLKG